MQHRRQNYFSPGPSFNCTNTTDQAASHVLHGAGVHRDPHTSVSKNPLMVLQFRIDLPDIIQSSTTKMLHATPSKGKYRPIYKGLPKPSEIFPIGPASRYFPLPGVCRLTGRY
ncbi:hypothetical protein B0H19DRAFT_1126981 [Mycena capillaripes]|nr:hypothetical protein B0H19DRAFT_1126981 [Mycena capillaripes]